MYNLFIYIKNIIKHLFLFLYTFSIMGRPIWMWDIDTHAAITTCMFFKKIDYKFIINYRYEWF